MPSSESSIPTHTRESSPDTSNPLSLRLLSTDFTSAKAATTSRRFSKSPSRKTSTFTLSQLTPAHISSAYGISSKTTLENSECKIAFLAKYTEKYHVDISDNGESAVIYNPVGEEHILFSYCGDEYTISFSFQHIHSYDRKDAESWIDDVVSDELLAIEFYKDEGVVMTAQIHPSAIRKLTYESLRAEFHHGNRELYEFSDSFKVRSWSGEKDLDAQFVHTDGKVMIKVVS
jgi:hypothetical protein